MPLQNRVTPLGDLVAEPGRGLVYGNRGCLHDERGRIRGGSTASAGSRAGSASAGGIASRCCNRARFTELFFLDEATAFAAGHRPCALCRREDYVRFGDLARGPGILVGADAIDAELHSEDRCGIRVHRLHEAAFDELPDGAFVLRGDVPFVVVGDDLLRWTTAGYVEHTATRSGPNDAHHTPSLVEVLRAGWRPVVPLLHPSAAPDDATG